MTAVRHKSDRKRAGWTLRWVWPAVVLVAIVLVPFFLAGPNIEGFVAQTLAGGGSGGWIALIIVAGLVLDVVLPVPSSLVLVASGAFFGLGAGTLVGWLGLSASCALGYWIGANCEHWLLRPFVTRAEQDQAAEMLQRRGVMFLAWSRAVPVLAETTTVLAGAVGMPFVRFAKITAAANLGIAAAYAACGAFAVSNGGFVLAFGAAILLPGLGLLVQRRYFSRD